MRISSRQAAKIHGRNFLIMRSSLKKFSMSSKKNFYQTRKSLFEVSLSKGVQISICIEESW